MSIATVDSWIRRLWVEATLSLLPRAKHFFRLFQAINIPFLTELKTLLPPAR